MPVHTAVLSLNQLNPEDKAKVVCIDFDEQNSDMFHFDRQRLADIGIIEGTLIEVLYKSPFGNPVAYFIRGTVFALRNETAEKIIVEIVEKVEKDEKI